jgi:hypothetical protein
LFGTPAFPFATIPPVTEPETIQGRLIGATEREQICHMMATHPDWSRRHLSQQLARLWEWRNARGQLKDMAARTLLLKLEQRGWITLPPRRQTPTNRMRHRPMPARFVPSDSAPIREPLAALLPLVITEVSTPAGASQRPLFEVLLHRGHYLGYRSTVGENLQYLVCDPQHRPLACLLFGAAAWQCADRDRYIGWDRQSRSQNLHLLTNNTRFLILPSVQVPWLASHVLSRISRRLSRDWQRKYGHPIYLLETFVEQDRFRATAYRAANWVRVGQTKGRTRQDRPDGTWHQAPIKTIYLYPLHPGFRERLQNHWLQPNHP